MAYATRDDYAAFVGKDPQELPTDIDRLLQRASELIDYVTLGRIDTSNNDCLANARDAVCAQVEYWESAGEDIDIQSSPEQVIIGSFEMIGRMPTLAPRARRILLLAGLLSRTVRQR